MYFQSTERVMCVYLSEYREGDVCVSCRVQGGCQSTERVMCVYSQSGEGDVCVPVRVQRG